MESRCHIYLEKYSKQASIEAGVTIDIARRGISSRDSERAAKMSLPAAERRIIGPNCE